MIFDVPLDDGDNVQQLMPAHPPRLSRVSSPCCIFASIIFGSVVLGVFASTSIVSRKVRLPGATPFRGAFTHPVVVDQVFEHQAELGSRRHQRLLLSDQPPHKGLASNEVEAQNNTLRHRGPGHRIQKLSEAAHLHVEMAGIESGNESTFDRASHADPEGSVGEKVDEIQGWLDKLREPLLHGRLVLHNILSYHRYVAWALLLLSTCAFLSLQASYPFWSSKGGDDAYLFARTKPPFVESVKFYCRRPSGTGKGVQAFEPLPRVERL